MDTDIQALLKPGSTGAVYGLFGLKNRFLVERTAFLNERGGHNGQPRFVMLLIVGLDRFCATMMGLLSSRGNWRRQGFDRR